MIKNIYLLGGNGLIGKELIKLYNNKHSNVIVLDIKTEKPIKKKKVKYVKFDCTSLLDMESVLKKIFKKNGKPDIFINCSYPVSKSWSKSYIDNIDYNLYKENVELHLNSYVWIAKIVAKVMKKYNNGSILLLGSIYGPIAQDPALYNNTGIKENFTYPIIKSGVIGATKQLASFYGKYNIRVNCICPGGIMGHVKGTKKKQSPKFLKKYLDKIMLNRFCGADEVAKACKFFASDMASYVTGQTIFVDGGYNSL